ncbi:MAG: HlyD family efflux transporter periplasmic adaptor subunit [Candidatus Paceibacterota bacterium]
MKYINLIKIWILKNKIFSSIGAIVLVGILYAVIWGFGGSAQETRYVLANVEKGNIISLVSGAGQVSTSNQVDLKTKVSGDLIYLNAKVGQQVSAGAVIGQVSASTAAYDLETAKLSYQELISVDKDELRAATDALEQAQTNLNNYYVDARTTLASASNDMADVMAGLGDLFGGYLSSSGSGISKIGKEYIDRAEQSWYDSEKLLNTFSKEYRDTSNETNNDTIESIISKANQVANAISQTAKYSKDAVIYLRDYQDGNSTTADEAYTTVSGLVTTSNSTVSSTLAVKNNIVEGKRTLRNADIDLQEIKDGPDVLDLRAKELSLKQKEQAYADYFIRAPFTGVIASVSARKMDAVSSGTTIATLITKQKIAEISLNEIDAAKIKVGQKATLTFDAIEGLTITGEVLEIDLIGTVSQGVVSYKVKIGFDTDDDRVKPSMTVNADITTDMREGVMKVPLSAIKTRGEKTYVEIVSPTETSGDRSIGGVLLASSPESVLVTTGLSNDESIEILSGLKEGDQYIARTIVGTTTKSTSTAPGLLGGSASRTSGSRAFVPK